MEDVAGVWLRGPPSSCGRVRWASSVRWWLCPTTTSPRPSTAPTRTSSSSTGIPLSSVQGGWVGFKTFPSHIKKFFTSPNKKLGSHRLVSRVGGWDLKLSPHNIRRFFASTNKKPGSHRLVSRVGGWDTFFPIHHLKIICMTSKETWTVPSNARVGGWDLHSSHYNFRRLYVWPTRKPRLSLQMSGVGGWDLNLSHHSIRRLHVSASPTRKTQQKGQSCQISRVGGWDTNFSHDVTWRSSRPIRPVVSRDRPVKWTGWVGGIQTLPQCYIPETVPVHNPVH